MVEPKVHEYVARNSDQYSSRFRDSYIPQIEEPCTFPLGKCVLAGTKIKNFRTKIGRLYKTSMGENIAPEWKETSSDSIRSEIAWMYWKKRLSEPKHRAIKWRLLKHRLVRDIITSGQENLIFASVAQPTHWKPLAMLTWNARP
ncbi:uncharacterized protein VTP21DRAFT_8986 [Calcarisporiella thermophila]|uniref:uncharacterized protein n=1 Tax=Calcarisporiella thermophila TaxID=911321 RepID=UPI003742C3B7